MLYAVKGNKQLKIDEAEKVTYLNLGYDIAKVNGDQLTTIETSPSKTVAWKEHQVIIHENDELKQKVEELQKKLAETIKKLKEAGKE